MLILLLLLDSFVKPTFHSSKSEATQLLRTAGPHCHLDEDELVEITPRSIRVRKRFLKEHERKRASREAA